MFNHTGDMLLTGSSDGFATIYDTSFYDKNKPIMADADEFSQVEPTFAELPFASMDISDETVLFKFDEKSSKYKLELQIEKIEWSANSRYAFCALGIKKESKDSKEDDSKPTLVKIKVYDTYSGRVIENLDRACNLGKTMTGFISIIKPHPFNDDLLLCCFDGGVNILYDVRQLIVLQEIVEYGIYSIDSFTMNNQMDVDFSADGDWIAFTSNYGTLSLYSTHAHRKYMY
jgi:WD40 repeat protein